MNARRLSPIFVRCRVSVRMFIVTVATCGSALGYWSYLARVQREAVTTIRREGGFVRYEDPGEESKVGAFATVKSWMSWGLGRDYCDTAKSVLVPNGVATTGVMRSVGKLSGLTYLNVQGATLTDAQMSAMCGLTRLTSLSLESCRVSDNGFREIGSLSRLELLDLTGTPIGDEVVTRIAGLKELRALWLVGRGISDRGLRKIAGLDKLDGLMLTDTNVTSDGLTALARHASLKELSVEGSHVRILEPLRNLTLLFSLNLAETAVDNESMKSLASLTSLDCLEIPNTDVGDNGLSNLRGLAMSRLVLNHTRITDEASAVLGELSGLWSIELRGTAAGDKCAAALASLPEIKIIDFRDTRLTDAGLMSFAKSMTCEEIKVTGSMITDEGVASLQRKAPQIVVVR